MSSNLFDYFADFLVLLPLILAARAIYPHPIVFRGACALVGLWLLYYFAPRFVPVMVIYWSAIWALQFLAQRGEKAGQYASAAIVIAIVAIPIAPMILWKLFPIWFQDTANDYALLTFDSLLPSLAYADFLVPSVIPLGLSFLTFRAVDLLIKIYLGLLPPVSPGVLFYYGFFPPILCVGPIAEIEEVARLPNGRFPKADDIAIGIFRVALGAIKVFVIAALLNVAASRLWAEGNAAVWARWLAMLAYGLFFYVNFSGYSETAIGCARLLGIKLKENFNNPFLKTNPQAFWNAWHMSLTRFAQRYVFTPLGGMRENRQYFAIFATIMTIALWHGLTIPIFVFGLFHASIVASHRFLQERQRLRGLPAATDNIVTLNVKRLLVLTFVSFSIPLLVLDSSTEIKFYLGLIGLSD